MSFLRGPVFIVGAPRSGTTLLQYILRSHPALSLPTGESHFFIPLIRREAEFGNLTKLENVKHVLQAMYAQSAEFLMTDLHGLKFDIGRLAEEFVQEGRHTMKDLIAGLFEKNAAGEGKSRWGDKTPYYVLHMPKLINWWPNAQFIHIVRDGRDVALSLFDRRHDFRVYNTYFAAKYWEQYVEIGREQGQKLPTGHYLEIRYEDILSDQAGSLERICHFLHEEYSDSLLEFKKAGIAGKTPLLQKPVQKDNQDKWRTAMTAGQIELFESAAGESLNKFGYALTSSARRKPLLIRALYRVHNSVLSRWYRIFGPQRTPWRPA